MVSHGSNDGAKVATGVVIALAASFLLAKAVKLIAQPIPKTMSAEWKTAEAKQLKERGINPVTGYGAK
jgi:hypothetical protein